MSIVSNTPSRARVSAIPKGLYNSGDRLQVVFLGNVEVAHGLLEPIDAIALLQDRGFPIRSRVMGSFRDIDLVRERTVQRRLDDEWVLDGFVPNPVARARLGEAHVRIVPQANFEWLAIVPNKLFDCMAAGLPVVASSVPPVARIRRQAKAGLFFDAGSAKPLADNLAKAASPPLLRVLADAGKRAIREHYAGSATLRRWFREFHRWQPRTTVWNERSSLRRVSTLAFNAHLSGTFGRDFSTTREPEGDRPSPKTGRRDS